MSIAEISVIAGGLLTLLIAVLHTRFYSMFGWKNEFAKISLLNSKIHYTIHLALLLIFFAFSFLSFIFVDELAKCSGLGLGVMIMFSLLWLWRTIWQILYFSPTGKDKKMHYVLTGMFGALFISYTIPIFVKFT
jgi:hypothetical protein